jgi:hypothetical protein
MDEKVSVRAYPKITRTDPRDVWCCARPPNTETFLWDLPCKKFFSSFKKNRDHHMTIMMVTPYIFVEK